jgi:hypothetical protein
MPLAIYEQVVDPAMQERLRLRYRTEIAQLQALDFREFCWYSETVRPFSAVIYLIPLLAMVLKREVVRIRSPLRVVSFHPLLVHREQAVYAHIFGLGVKFYTRFEDTTGLVTANFESHLVPKGPSPLEKSGADMRIAEAWALHQEGMARAEAEGKAVDRSVRFEAYVEVARWEDELAPF